MLWDPGNRRVYRHAAARATCWSSSRTTPTTTATCAGGDAARREDRILVPSLNRLYVAASPGETKSMGQLVWLDVDPRK